MMNSRTFLQRLFEGYVVSFRKFGWHTTSSYSDITAAELTHYSELGAKLGYLVRREMNWHFPRDLCWVPFGSKEAYLYMERENKDSRCKHTIEKMLNPANSKEVTLLVASFGFLRPDSFSWAKDRLRDELLKHQSALLYAWVGLDENMGPFEIMAAVIDADSIVECQAIPSIDEGGFWQINYGCKSAEWL
jgi:hypothetical protein